MCRGEFLFLPSLCLKLLLSPLLLCPSAPKNLNDFPYLSAIHSYTLITSQTPLEPLTSVDKSYCRAWNRVNQNVGRYQSGVIALHQLPQRLKNITAVRPRANLSLISKAVGVADGELIKNRLGISKLLYF